MYIQYLREITVAGAIERIVVQATPRQKKAIAAKAKKLGLPISELMRRGASDEELVDFIRGVVQRKEERHHIGEPDFVPASRTMVHIGG